MSKIVVDLRLLDDGNRSGMGNYTYNLVRELIKLDRESYYFVGDFRDQSLFPDDHHFSLGLPHSDIPFSNRLLALDGYARDYDLLYSPYYPIPERRTFKGVLNLMDLIPLRHPEFFLSNTLYDIHIRKCVESIDHIVAISEATKSDAIHFFQLDPNKISVIYPGLDPTFLNVSAVSGNDKFLLNDLKITGSYILSVCTLEPRKNLIRVLEAYKQLRLQKRDELYLVLVGGLGWKYQSLLEQIENHPFKDYIILTGYVPENVLPVLYRNAEVFVYPSLYEGFGLPILEAMACGVPVVTSNLSSLPEVGGTAATYCDPYAVESIADGIQSILDDSAKRAQSIHKGYEQAKRFSYSNAAAQIHNLFLKVIASQ